MGKNKKCRKWMYWAIMIGIGILFIFHSFPLKKCIRDDFFVDFIDFQKNTCYLNGWSTSYCDMANSPRIRGYTEKPVDSVWPQFELREVTREKRLQRHSWSGVLKLNSLNRKKRWSTSPGLLYKNRLFHNFRWTHCILSFNKNLIYRSAFLIFFS